MHNHQNTTYPTPTLYQLPYPPHYRHIIWTFEYKFTHPLLLLPQTHIHTPPHTHNHYHHRTQPLPPTTPCAHQLPKPSSYRHIIWTYLHKYLQKVKKKWYDSSMKGGSSFSHKCNLIFPIFLNNFFNRKKKKIRQNEL